MVPLEPLQRRDFGGLHARAGTGGTWGGGTVPGSRQTVSMGDGVEAWVDPGDANRGETHGKQTWKLNITIFLQATNGLLE